MNVLGIDYGSKRIGLALGSTEGGVAAPMKVAAHKGESALIEEIRAVTEGEEIGLVVVGLPLTSEGGDSAQTERIRAFHAKLEDALDIPVKLEDERLSSREIEKHMEAMGGKKAWAASGFDRDSAAATLFLQTWLDRTRTE